MCPKSIKLKQKWYGSNEGIFTGGGVDEEIFDWLGRLPHPPIRETPAFLLSQMQKVI